MRLVVDSREQCPFLFGGFDCDVERGTLAIGDYSLHGLEHLVAVERKSLPDLVGCLGRGRDRFLAELMRARGLDSFAVVVEASWQELALGLYRSKLSPQSATASVLAFQSRLRVPFLFAGNREEAERVTYQHLRLYAQGREQEARAVLESVGSVKVRRRPPTIVPEKSCEDAL